MSTLPDGKETKKVTQQTANDAKAIMEQTAGLPQTISDVDEVKRSSHHAFFLLA